MSSRVRWSITNTVTIAVLLAIRDVWLYGAIWMTPDEMLARTMAWVHNPHIHLGALILLLAWVMFMLLIWVPPFFIQRRFKSLDDILKQFPRKHIPSDGKWPASNGEANSALLKKVVGRHAQVAMEVEGAWIHPEGRYANIPFIVARFTKNPLNNLPLFLYAYFDKATPEVTKVVLSHNRHDFVQLMGKITRADLVSRDDKGVCLNIDLNDCEFVKR